MKMPCLRSTLIALTLLVWIAGSVAIGYGGYVMVKDMKFKGLTGNLILDGSLLALACLVFITGFFGCLGATLQKRIFLRIFLVMLAIFLFLQIILVVLYFVQKSQLEALMAANWNEMNDNGRIAIQKEFNCCGMRKGESFQSFSDPSCYSSNSTRHDNTCFKAMDAWLERNVAIVGTCGVVIASIELLSLLLTCLLIRQIGRETTVVPLNRGRDRHPATTSSGPQRRATGMVPRPIQPLYDDGNDMYMEDYEEPRLQYPRKEWARHNYGRDYRGERGRR